MPTFCRHGRFIERCPICNRDLPGVGERSRATGSTARRSVPRAAGAQSRTRTPAREGLKVRRETRADDDGYRSTLVPGLRASLDAERLADELGFATGRLLALGAAPPGLYAEVATLDDLEQASWLAFLIAYLCPVEGDDPFVGIRQAVTDWHTGELPDLEGLPLGPRTSHVPGSGTQTLIAYRQWAERAGSQAQALRADDAWTPERRFERVFERMALPGFGRVGRYELLVVLGRLGRYPLRGDALYLAGDDTTTLAAKRVFGIGDRLNLERRARDLAQAAEVPIEALDLALANWTAEERATMACPPECADEQARERTRSALGL